MGDETGKNRCNIWRPEASEIMEYAPVLRYFYGEAPVVEMHTATEGVFAQQLDDLPYVSPNYDTYFFEVVTRGGVKMLYEMKRGEWGRLLVSSCLLPLAEV